MSCLFVGISGSRFSIPHVWSNSAASVIAATAKLLGCFEIGFCGPSRTIDDRLLRRLNSSGFKISHLGMLSEEENLARNMIYKKIEHDELSSLHFLGFASRRESIETLCSLKSVHPRIHCHIFIDRLGDINGVDRTKFDSVLFPFNKKAVPINSKYTANSIGQIRFWSKGIRDRTTKHYSEERGMQRWVYQDDDFSCWVGFLALIHAVGNGEILVFSRKKNQGSLLLNDSTERQEKAALNICLEGISQLDRALREADRSRWLRIIQKPKRSLADGLLLLLSRPAQNTFSARKHLTDKSAVISYIQKSVPFWNVEKGTPFKYCDFFDSLNGCSEWIELKHIDLLLKAVNLHGVEKSISRSEIDICLQLLHDFIRIKEPVHCSDFPLIGELGLLSRVTRKSILIALIENSKIDSKASAALGYKGTGISGFQGKRDRAFPGVSKCLLAVLISNTG